MGRLTIVFALLFALLPLAASAHGTEAYRTEVQVGPYPVVVEFSEWPMRAERSVDIFIEPAGGIADKSGTLRVLGPGLAPGDDAGPAFPLVRHPRQRDVWGLDLIALPWPGDWTIELTIDGPAGHGAGTIGPITLLERPGPPAAAIWLVGALPLVFLVWLLVRSWRRVQPARIAEAGTWTSGRGRVDPGWVHSV